MRNIAKRVKELENSLWIENGHLYIRMYQFEGAFGWPVTRTFRVPVEEVKKVWTSKEADD